ncbi:MAG: endonuclease MutS2 [Erysipelotrichaceae bacterium]|nr:endonuclease MutS2 [Erysipelotrichaceae bacterium]
MSVENSLELNVILEQVARHCSFSLSKEAVLNTVPSFDPLIIRRDQSRVKEALKAVIKYGNIPMAGIRDLSEMLKNAAKGRILSANDLNQEIRFIQGIRSVVSYKKELTDFEHPFLDDLIDTLVVHEHTEKYLSRCINEYGEVMDSASHELAAIRANIRRAEHEIAQAANRFVASHSDSVIDGIITYRSGRALILVRASEKNQFGGLVYGDSASGQASYIEPAALVTLNNRRQGYLDDEQLEIERILTECSREVTKVAKEELANLETCAILDTVFAKAAWGAANDACCAELSETKEIELIKARHPLIDPLKVVANTYHISDPKRILLITGPNTGGKTVSMKVIGLFTLMTYCGMPVTCESASIPYFDRVFADIGDDQSVVSSLSSFSAHVSKQAEICREATGNSLVLLDEVGSGTDPNEGEALAIAILNRLREISCMCVATTHYSRLKAYGKRHDDILCASVEFDMKHLMPTYRYMEGTTGSSNAFEVAERYGLPKGIVKYARFLRNQAKTEEDTLIERLEAQLNESRQLSDELEKKIAENEEIRKNLEKKKIILEKQKDEFHAKAEKEAAAYIESVKEEADEILEKLRKSSQSIPVHEAIAERGKLSKIVKTEEPEIIEDENREYKVGDAVELRSSNQVCEIVSIGRKDMKVLLNGREIRVRKDQIRPSLHVIPKMKEKETTTIHIASRNIFASMPLECNLIGLHVDEALSKMGDYMDQAKVHSLKTFRIIHGDGTGRLRKAVHDRLSKDKDVEEFRLGMPNEGGTGATVVVMK